MTDESYQTLRYEVAGGILTLWLDRPDQLNAFTVEMADELEHAFRRASDDDEVRAVVVTGSGRAFCAGMDLSVGGNVFGLDETQRPTPGTWLGGSTTRRSSAGCATPGAG
jgi:enoyl-CoA hydratase/carnithine racemase